MVPRSDPGQPSDGARRHGSSGAKSRVGEATNVTETAAEVAAAKRAVTVSRDEIVDVELAEDQHDIFRVESLPEPHKSASPAAAAETSSAREHCYDEEAFSDSIHQSDSPENTASDI